MLLVSCIKAYDLSAKESLPSCESLGLQLYAQLSYSLGKGDKARPKVESFVMPKVWSENRGYFSKLYFKGASADSAHLSEVKLSLVSHKGEKSQIYLERTKRFLVEKEKFYILDLDVRQEFLASSSLYPATLTLTVVGAQAKSFCDTKITFGVIP